MRKGLDKRKIVNYNKVNNNAKVRAEISRPVFVADIERRNIFSSVFSRLSFCRKRTTPRAAEDTVSCGGSTGVALRLLGNKDIVNSILVPDTYKHKDIISDFHVGRKEELPPQPAGTQNGPDTPGKPGGNPLLQ